MQNLDNNLQCAWCVVFIDWRLCFNMLSLCGPFGPVITIHNTAGRHLPQKKVFFLFVFFFYLRQALAFKNLSPKVIASVEPNIFETASDFASDCFGGILSQENLPPHYSLYFDSSPTQDTVLSNMSLLSCKTNKQTEMFFFLTCTLFYMFADHCCLRIKVCKREH